MKYVQNGNRAIKMEFKKKDRPHTKHYFVVDKSNTFSVCSICGLKKERKIIGWDMRSMKHMHDTKDD